MPSAYVPDNADATHGRIAQLMGGIEALTRILNAQVDGRLIARKEDLDEVFDESQDEQ